MAPYRPAVFWWEAVLLLHRLSLAFLYTFGSTAPAEQSILAVTVCVGFLLLHSHVRPFAHAKTQRVQTALLLSLSIMALARVFSSSLVQLGTPPDAATAAAISSTNAFCAGLSGVFQYAVPAAALLLPVPGLRGVDSLKPVKSSAAVAPEPQPLTEHHELAAT